jgi:uncharacterized BrkB/YihY/UPF0761 family membrane protein
LSRDRGEIVPDSTPPRLTTTQRAKKLLDDVERRPVAGFPIASYRRMKEMQGKHLAFVVGGNLFIAVIPLFIIGYAIIEAFNPDRSIAVVVIQRFQLKGQTALLVRQTFGNARSGRNTAIGLSLVSLLLTGFTVATTMQLAYARAFRVDPLRGPKKLARGTAWLFLMLAVSAIGLTLRYWAHGRPWWFLLLVVPGLVAVSFLFFLVSPRLLLDLPFEWRHLMVGAGVCVVAHAIVTGVSTFLMRKWLSAYGHAYGGYGIALAFLAWVGLFATFWVWTGAIAAVYWDRFATSREIAELAGAQPSAAQSPSGGPAPDDV